MLKNLILQFFGLVNQRYTNIKILLMMLPLQTKKIIVVTIYKVNPNGYKSLSKSYKKTVESNI